MAAIQTVPLLFSVSIAASASSDSLEKTDRSRSPESSSAGNPYIKNTFVEVDEGGECSPTQRSASAPPAPRGSVQIELDAPQILCMTSAPRVLKSPSFNTMAWADYDTDDEDERGFLTESSDRASSVSSDSDSTSVQLTLSDLVAPPPSPPPEAQRVKLSTGAKVWTPGMSAQPVSSKLNAPAQVRDEFDRVLTAGQAAFRGYPQITNVSRAESSVGWSVTASIPLSAAHNAQVALSHAQNCLLAATERSTGVYIVGYESVPFAQSSTGLGFTAQLAMVADEDAACWDLLKAGYCRRSCSCRWQHPAQYARVHFELKCTAA